MAAATAVRISRRFAMRAKNIIEFDWKIHTREIVKACELLAVESFYQKSSCHVKKSWESL